jgi:hypothetical protein
VNENGGIGHDDGRAPILPPLAATAWIFRISENDVIRLAPDTLGLKSLLLGLRES